MIDLLGEAPESEATRVGSGLTFHVLHSRVDSWPHPQTLGWKDLPGANALAYYKNS
jgi:hypothetical protein